MSISTSVDFADLQHLSDQELVGATRDGDRRAYAYLWQRHSESARRVAKAVSWRSDADDLVAEAFTRILKAIKAGGGPPESFRPYLFTTIRNVSMRWSQANREYTVDELQEQIDDSQPDPAELLESRTTVERAFSTLPESWRTVLWYVDVEGMAPREVAPLIGMRPNAVSALSYRARAGYRKAWIEMHIADQSKPEECKWACQSLMLPKRKSLTAESERLGIHIEECDECRLVAGDPEGHARRLRSVLLIVALGAPAASIYAQMSDVTLAAAAVLLRSARLKKVLRTSVAVAAVFAGAVLIIVPSLSGSPSSAAPQAAETHESTTVPVPLIRDQGNSDRGPIAPIHPASAAGGIVNPMCCML